MLFPDASSAKNESYSSASSFRSDENPFDYEQGSVAGLQINPETGFDEKCQLGDLLRFNKLLGHKGYVQSIAISSVGDYMVSGGHDKTFVRWDLKTGTQVGVHPTSAWVRAVAFSPIKDSPIFAIGEDDGSLSFWNFETGVCIVHNRPEKKKKGKRKKKMKEREKA
jgi:WD40 repeat protein